MTEVQTTPPPDGDEAPVAVKRTGNVLRGWIGGEAGSATHDRGQSGDLSDSYPRLGRTLRGKPSATVSDEASGGEPSDKQALSGGER